MPVYRRGGRPGLIGLAARTAVVAGTSTAVSGGMRARQQNKAAQAQQAAQAQAAQAQQAAQASAPVQPPVTPAPAPAAPEPVDPMTQKLQQLAALHSQGILTDEEFSASKARLLGL